jgi:hypothetical protein
MRGASLRCAVLALAIWSGAALALQQLPAPSSGPDIVVTAGTPKMVAGLWTFHATAASFDTPTGRSRGAGRGPRDWSVCARDGDTPAILEQLVGEQATFDGTALCSKMGLTIADDRVSGSQRCPLPPMGTGDGGLIAETRVRARIAKMRLTAGYTYRAGRAGGDAPKMRWRVSAERVGDCTIPTLAGLPPAQDVRPSMLKMVQSDAARPPDRAREEPLPGDADHSIETAPPAATSKVAPPPASVAQADDIVVVARKLRRLRLHYASSGKAFRWCHADISSGDPRLDRIGCALVRACVRQGFDDTVSALACVNRRIDMLDSAVPPERGGG